jgi:hypothetical protein
VSGWTARTTSPAPARATYAFTATRRVSRRSTLRSASDAKRRRPPPGARVAEALPLERAAAQVPQVARIGQPQRLRVGAQREARVRPQRERRAALLHIHEVVDGEGARRCARRQHLEERAVRVVGRARVAAPPEPEARAATAATARRSAATRLERARRARGGPGAPTAALDGARSSAPRAVAARAGGAAERRDAHAPVAGGALRGGEHAARCKRAGSRRSS